MKYLIQVPASDPSPGRGGKFLQGPRTPERVKRDGYGFTLDAAAAWRFASRAKAAAKARIVNAHMGWGEVLVVVEAGTEGAP